jgi:hypothetical protein
MNTIMTHSVKAPLSSATAAGGERPLPKSGRRRRLCAVAAGLASVLVLLAGCGKKSTSANLKPEDVTPVDPNASVAEQQNQRVKMAVAVRDGIMPPEPTLQLKGGEPATPEVLAAYNQLLLRYMVQNKEAPETMQELLRIRTLPPLPTPPAGKRIVYDAANCCIRLDPP